MSYSVCNTCILDTTDPEITFNSEGTCHYCQNFEGVKKQLEENYKSQDQYFLNLKSELDKNKNRKYDSIIGLSGGVDSSYTVLLAKKYGFNPLLVHFDNGWNSETAVSNIRKLADYGGYDLKTYVINWNEFKDLQRSFLLAGVLDIEMLTDHAIMAALYQISRETGLKNVLSGNNLATEYGMPPSWSWNKRDWTNIKDIHRQYGSVKLKTFPVFSTWKWIFVKRLKLGMNFIELLNHMPYRKADAIEELQKQCDWVYYGGKHYESIFTKFYQAYILPRKFNIDKRKAHYSSLIRNGEITREDALSELNKPLYLEEDLLEEKSYVLKKLGFSEDEFEKIMNESPRSHLDFKTDQHLFNRIQKLRGKL